VNVRTMILLTLVLSACNSQGGGAEIWRDVYNDPETIEKEFCIFFPDFCKDNSWPFPTIPPTMGNVDPISCKPPAEPSFDCKPGGFDQGCKAGLYCMLVNDANFQCTGANLEDNQLGEFCDSDHLCSPGQACLANLCVATCLDESPPTTACHYYSPLGAGLALFQCDPLEYGRCDALTKIKPAKCVPSSSGEDFVCVPKYENQEAPLTANLDTGEHCSRNEDCEEGAICLYNDDLGPCLLATCRAYCSLSQSKPEDNFYCQPLDMLPALKAYPNVGAWVPDTWPYSL